jgi:hypothetical protein
MADPVGLDPKTGDEVNVQTGTHLREFVNIKETIGHDADWLLGIDLKVEPYNLSADSETTIKSAIQGLDTALDAVDMTFINRMTGLF